MKGKGVCAIVSYEYEASEDNEMHLIEGELIEEIEKVDEGWWFGVGGNGAKRGLFPADYVEEIDQGAEPEPQNQGTTAIALYDYDADEENEVSFREGDRIVKIEPVSDDWWQGRTADGSVGLFPANHVELRQ